MSILDYAKDIFKNPGAYKKFWAAVLGGVLTLSTIYLGSPLWVPVVTQALTALGVFGVTNQ